MKIGQVIQADWQFGCFKSTNIVVNRRSISLHSVKPESVKIFYLCTKEKMQVIEMHYLQEPYVITS